jgi:GAF domain-containing protein
VLSGTPHPLVGENAYLQTNGIDLYAGAPLILPDGECVGALVLLDHEPRAFTDEDVARLMAAADDLVQRFGDQEAPAAPEAAASAPSPAPA